MDAIHASICTENLCQSIVLQHTKNARGSFKHGTCRPTVMAEELAKTRSQRQLYLGVRVIALFSELDSLEELRKLTSVKVSAPSE